jgi:hypothetical protein
MNDVGARIAASAFPASAIVILSVYIIQGAFGLEVPGEASAAATGLLTWLAFVLLGAGLPNGVKK